MKLTVISSYWREVFKVLVTGKVLYLIKLPAMTFYNAQNNFAITQQDPVVNIDRVRLKSHIKLQVNNF